MVILSNLPPPSEGVRFQQPQTSALLENRDLGVGTLYVADSCVSWVGPEGNGFSLQYPAISLHAISRDRTSFPEECLYLMVEAPANERRNRNKCQPSLLFESMTSELAEWKLVPNNQEPKPQASSEVTGSGGIVGGGMANGGGHEEQGEDAEDADEEDSPITQIRFVPVDKTVLDDIFKAMSDCQALHPDENESFSEEENDDEGEGVEEEEEGAEVLDAEGRGDGDGEWFTSAEDVVHLNPEGQAVLNRIFGSRGDGGGEEAMDESESANQDGTGQFDDAD